MRASRTTALALLGAAAVAAGGFTFAGQAAAVSQADAVHRAHHAGTRHHRAHTTPTTVVAALKGDKLYPESLVADPATGDIYVTGFGDGAVQRIPAGSRTAEVFLPAGTDGRTAATGAKIWGDQLWVADFSGLNVYSLTSRQRLAHFAAPFEKAMVNDIAFTADGTGYLTDSGNPVIYQVSQADIAAYADKPGAERAKSRLPIGRDLNGTPAAYTQHDSPNLNGIVSDGRYLVAVNFTSGRLFRVDTTDGEVREIAYDGPRLVSGDGLFRRGRTLYAARNKANAVTRLSLGRGDLTAHVEKNIESADLQIPTSVIAYEGRILVTRSQFDKGGPYAPGTPELPFSVAAVAGL
ncbi:hypothetical protein AV521_43910 [Streptomyces sp. IMTB 2501]|uniref:hypothetical protein n=1 Tax=Streptomyces sp. IMTB 2501 TaxID=1776340 RepID=UPI00096CCCB4|nr:hypothetical protein [Streptomyces sp. IMTB 2501]OLZ61277.1 hypothetical protein AV521_43910 [Streptomyces sp. IMTB 2501]